LIGTGIDHEEDVALAHILSFNKADPHESTVHLGLHGDGVHRLDGANRLEVDGDIPPLRGACGYGHGAPPAAARVLLLLRAARREEQRRGQQGG
jgi:hypothetical protein